MSFAISGFSPAIATFQPQTRRPSADDNSSAETAETSKKTDAKESSPGIAGKSESASLNQQELQKLQSLKARDLEVKTHELAHLSAAGGIALGGASFEYQQGPDGVRYAVGGEVNIDTSAVQGDPAATLSKAQQIQRAALAPANPSSQDRQVAAKASAMAANARVELMKNIQQSTAPNGEPRQVRGGNINISV